MRISWGAWRIFEQWPADRSDGHHVFANAGVSTDLMRVKNPVRHLWMEDEDVLG